MARARPSPPSPPRALALAAAGLGAVATGWALWLWRQLLVARAGGQASCGLGDDGSACVAAWDSAFASAVHAGTGLPVAAWGAVWGALAVAFPLATLLASRRRGGGRLPWAGALCVAAGGLAAVLGLSLALVIGGELCRGCIVTYGLVLAYAALLFFGTPRLPRAELGRGAGAAAAALVGAWMLLLVPGLRTPRATPEVALPGASDAALPGALPGETARLEQFVAMLPQDTAQAVSDALFAWQRSLAAPSPEPRALQGSPMAPVRITDWADLMCGHCASLHRALEELRRAAPAGSFAVESRFFPLDGSCNPAISRKGDGVRCLAAKALICLEDEPRFFEAASRIYGSQRDLSEEKVFELLEPLRSRERLESCTSSPETDAKLQSDIRSAMEQGITGTPLVLANGRRAAAFPPFLYALVLSGGDPDHPGLSSLPPPREGGNRASGTGAGPS